MLRKEEKEEYKHEKDEKKRKEVKEKVGTFRKLVNSKYSRLQERKKRMFTGSRGWRGTKGEQQQ